MQGFKFASMKAPLPEGQGIVSTYNCVPRNSQLSEPEQNAGGIAGDDFSRPLSLEAVVFWKMKKGRRLYVIGEVVRTAR
jgi:hypothetical protein